MALGLAIFVLAFFQPQKLFIDDRVDEAAVIADESDTGSAEEATIDPAIPDRTGGGGGNAEVIDTGSDVPVQPAAPKEVSQAGFRSLEHPTTGRAIVTELPDGSRFLRFENFETSNGPDLRVYLSAGSNDADFGAEYGEDFVELGRLKGNIGNQNYEIPAGTDLAKYRNAVVWCARFSVGFGVATLS